jgi:hypothetical protein
LAPEQVKIAIIDQREEHKVRLVAGGDMAAELPEYTYQGAWTSDQVIANKRETLVRVLAAYAKLYRVVQTPEAKDTFLRARKTIYPNGTELEGLLQWRNVQNYKPFSIDLILSEERLNYMQQLEQIPHLHSHPSQFLLPLAVTSCGRPNSVA